MPVRGHTKTVDIQPHEEHDIPIVSDKWKLGASPAANCPSSISAARLLSLLLLVLTGALQAQDYTYTVRVTHGAY
jgi:hypothetical protein